MGSPHPRERINNFECLSRHPLRVFLIPRRDEKQRERRRCWCYIRLKKQRLPVAVAQLAERLRQLEDLGSILVMGYFQRHLFTVDHNEKTKIIEKRLRMVHSKTHCCLACIGCISSFCNEGWISYWIYFSITSKLLIYHYLNTYCLNAGYSLGL